MENYKVNPDLTLEYNGEVTKSKEELESQIAYHKEQITDLEQRLEELNKKKELPKTWAEFYSTNKLNFEGIVVPEQYEVPIIMLSHLLLLRDCYNDGWKPDWEDNIIKNIIYNEMGKVCTSGVCHSSHILAFKTAELRDEFLKNFRNIIEIAKDLI